MPRPHVALNTRSRKLALVAGCMLVACGVVIAAAVPWLADRASSEVSRAALKRATDLEPDNAERHFQLGRFSQLVDQDFPAAADAYRRATDLNPHVASYWLATATTAQFFGDTASQAVALRRAIEADPANPSVAWEAANFFLLRGELPDAVRLYRAALQYEPGLTPLAVSQLWRKTHDAALIADQALPPDPIYYAEFLKLLIAEAQPEAAAQVWRRWAASKSGGDVQLAFPYIDFLLTRSEISAARDAWTLLAQSSPMLRARAAQSNLIYNGDFEHQILNGGFEWRYTPAPLTSLELENTQFHSGNSALQIDYQGATAVDSGITQFIPVSPNTTYTFRGYMRAEAIYAAHGPRFAITDQRTGATLWKSDELLGTAGWQERVGSFTAGPETRLVALRIVREEPSRIKGRIWIDDVALSIAEPAATAGKDAGNAH